MTQLERLQMVEDAMPEHLTLRQKQQVVANAIRALVMGLLQKSQETMKPVERKPYSYGYHESENPAYRTVREVMWK